MFYLRKNWKIQVIDDEPDILRTLKRILEKKGYTVSTFEDPLRALEKAKMEAFDLVITDLKMEEMDGIEFLHGLKKIRPAVPVILVTGYATIGTAVTAMESGAFDYIRKPFEIKKIMDVVESALSSVQAPTPFIKGDY